MPAKTYRGRISRPSRRDEATGMLQGAVDAMREWLEDEKNAEHEDRGEVESLADELENTISEAESIDFPGMYG